MAIKKNAKGAKFLNTEGEFKVRVSGVKIGQSKKGAPMLTVTFETDDGEQISSYFVKSLAFHIHSLKELKAALGLAENAPSEDMQGKRCGISVEFGDEQEDGKVYAQVVGYGKESDVDSAPVSAPMVGGEVEVPF